MIERFTSRGIQCSATEDEHSNSLPINKSQSFLQSPNSLCHTSTLHTKHTQIQHPTSYYYNTLASKRSPTMSKEKHRERRHFFRGIASLCVTITFIILLIILIVYLVLRPTKPKFYLQNLHLIKINASPASNTPPTLTINLQATLSSRNPNNRIGIYYSSLDTYVTYRDEPVTVPVALPPIYEGHKDVAVWSPVLYGSGVPVDPYVANAIAQDQAAGLLLLHVKVAGRVKWKVGTWTSGHYHLFVSCPVFVSPSNGNPIPGDGLPETVECHVEV